MGSIAHPAALFCGLVYLPTVERKNMKTAHEAYTESEIPSRLRDAQHRISETARNVSHVTDEYVHDHPWQTLAIAAVVGCVIGFLIGNRD